MKRLIASMFLLSSFNLFAAELNAVDAMLSILPIGTYKGVTEADVPCTVSVNEVNFPDKAITVTAADSMNKIFKIITDGSEFLFRAYKSEFIQTERFYVDDNRISYVDRIVRTVDAGNDRLYVVVANESTVNRDVRAQAVECVIPSPK